MIKSFEKLFLKCLKPVIEKNNLIPDHQFGFRTKHSTVDQVHRITNVFKKVLEEKQICTTIFLDIAQAFDKVWHCGLEYKLERDLPKHHCQLLKSYISNRYFRVKYEDSYSELKEISAGIPQGSVLGPVLYLLYMSNIPACEEATICHFC